MAVLARTTVDEESASTARDVAPVAVDEQEAPAAGAPVDDATELDAEPAGESRRPNRINAIALVLFVVVCEAVGVVGSTFTDTSPGSWFDQLEKPSFMPPNWAFPVAWTTLYAVMAYAAWRVWRRRGPEPDRSRALVVFGTQLLLNGLWAPVFFGAQAPWIAMLVMAGLWIAVLAMLLTFAPVDPLAAVLTVPYLAWVTFAAALNAAIILMA
jgi:tryptophan-rich sensory protein